MVHHVMRMILKELKIGIIDKLNKMSDKVHKGIYIARKRTRIENMVIGKYVERETDSGKLYLIKDNENYYHLIDHTTLTLISDNDDKLSEIKDRLSKIDESNKNNKKLLNDYFGEDSIRTLIDSGLDIIQIRDESKYIINLRTGNVTLMDGPFSEIGGSILPLLGSLEKEILNLI